MDPTPERFTRLARSSPWRWRTLRLSYATLGRDPDPADAAEAWLRRPDGLRVRRPDGGVHPMLVEGSRGWSALSDPGDGAEAPAQLLPRDVMPERDADGLVTLRPRDPRIRYDDPMWQSYRWVALLDPVELAENVWTGNPGPVTFLGDVIELDHHGRPAWEARMATTEAYDPRCGCCPLLPDARIAELERPGTTAPEGGWATEHRVRLDVATGVCVLAVEVRTTGEGYGHDVTILGVDEPMDDALFTAPTRRWGRRPSGPGYASLADLPPGPGLAPDA